jgi:uncharacterized protein YjbJ (UPF0337 family)
VDRLVGKAKQAAGSLLGRSDLKSEGRLQKSRADAVELAVEARAEADHEREAAEITARRQELEAEKARLEAEEADERDRQRVARAEAAEEAAIQSGARAAEDAAERQARAGEQAVDAEERRASTTAATGRPARELDQEARRQELAADLIDPNHQEKGVSL